MAYFSETNAQNAQILEQTLKDSKKNKSAEHAKKKHGHKKHKKSDGKFYTLSMSNSIIIFRFLL